MVDNDYTVKDRIGDPAGWPSVPSDFHPPNDSYLLARLGSIVPDGMNVVVVFESDGRIYTNLLEMETAQQASWVCHHLQERVGELLLDALNEKLVD